MSCDDLCKNTLAPLFLRLALAGIFIYHGVEKVRDPNTEMGAAWANVAWSHQAKPPQNVIDRIRAGTADEKERNEVENELRIAYNRTAPAIPGALQYQAAQMAVAWGELIGGIALLLGFPHPSGRRGRGRHPGRGRLLGDLVPGLLLRGRRRVRIQPRPSGRLRGPRLPGRRLSVRRSLALWFPGHGAAQA